jgi:hypothetical protein
VEGLEIFLGWRTIDLVIRTADSGFGHGDRGMHGTFEGMGVGKETTARTGNLMQQGSMASCVLE